MRGTACGNTVRYQRLHRNFCNSGKIMLTKRQRRDLMELGCLSMTEAAQFTGLSTDTIYRAMRNKEIVFVKKGRRRVVPKAGLIDWLGQSVSE